MQFEEIIVNDLFDGEKWEIRQKNLINCQYIPGQTNKDILKKAHIIYCQATRGISNAIDRVKEIYDANRNAGTG